MESKRGAFIVVVVVLIILFGTLWVYDSFVGPKSQSVKLGNEGAMLQGYVKETLLREYVPERLNVKRNLLSDGTVRGADYTYGAIWVAGNVDPYGFLYYDQSLNYLAELGLFIRLNETVSLNQETATSLVERYVKGNYALTCKTRSDSSIVVCEDFVKGETSESGVGVFVLPEYNLTTIFACRHFKNRYVTGSCLQGRSP